MNITPFSKTEMVEQLCNALLLFVRSTAWVMDREAAHRLMGWNVGDAGALTGIDETDFREVARLEGQELDASKFSVVRTFSDLYDYGVLGLLQSTIFPIDNATEATFAMSFVFDCQNSQLQFEMQAGGSLAVDRCTYTAEAAMARQVLDGGGRPLIGSDDKPDRLLTMREVAILGNIDERSVRNAASGKPKPDQLKTTVVDGERFVAPEDARTWLALRRGFTPTQHKGHLVELDLAARPFDGPWEVVDFVKQRLALHGLAWPQAARTLGLTAGDAEQEFQPVLLSTVASADVATRLGELLKVGPQLFALRLEECLATEQLHGLRRSINTLRSKG